MDIRKLQRAIVDGLEDVKAQNIVVFNTEHLTPLFERVIIASGTSNRQTKALAASVRESVKARGMQVMRIEGEDNGEWIIVDCGAAVAHIMQPAIRDYYHLEELWGDKAVRMKLAPESATRAAARPGPAPGGDGGQELEALAGPGREAVRATPGPAAKGKGAVRGGAAKQPAGPRATERITGTRSASPGTPGRKQAARQGAAKRSGAKPAAPGKAGSARAVAAKAGARKAAPKKVAPKKTATRSAAKAAKKAPPRRVPAKKAPASKAAPGRSSRSGRR